MIEGGERYRKRMRTSREKETRDRDMYVYREIERKRLEDQIEKEIH